MSSFDERKKGFEKKFAHDEEKQFKINARKNKYLGEWASQILGYDEEKKNQYVQDVIKADFAEAGDEDVYRKLYEDLKDKNISEDQIRKKMQECNEKATTEVSKFSIFIYICCNKLLTIRNNHNFR